MKMHEKRKNKMLEKIKMHEEKLKKRNAKGPPILFMMESL